MEGEGKKGKENQLGQLQILWPTTRQTKIFRLIPHHVRVMNSTVEKNPLPPWVFKVPSYHDSAKSQLSTSESRQFIRVKCLKESKKMGGSQGTCNAIVLPAPGRSIPLAQSSSRLTKIFCQLATNYRIWTSQPSSLSFSSVMVTFTFP